MFELKKVQRSYVRRLWRLLRNLKEDWLVLSKMTWRIWQTFVHRLKTSDFILERKMVKLNLNKNSKQPDRPDTVWKLYFTKIDKIKMEIKINSTINKFIYKCSTESLFLRNKKIFKKAVKLGSFLQCSIHIFLGHDDCVWKINFVRSYHEELSSKAWSVGQHHIPPKHFLSKVLSNYC